MKRLGLVLSTSSRSDFNRLERLAQAARRKQVEVAIFLMDEAVRWIGDSRIRALIDEGCEISACATNVGAHDFMRPVPGVVIGSQDDHAALVHRADRVVSFT